MAYNKTKRCIKKHGKNKTRKNKTSRKRSGSRKISSRMRKGGSPSGDMRAQILVFLTNIRTEAALDAFIAELPKGLYPIFKDNIDARRASIQGDGEVVYDLEP